MPARPHGAVGWPVGRWAGCSTRRALGRDRLLVVCATGNVASARTIERCGGVFEGIGETRFGPTRRYRITLYG